MVTDQRLKEAHEQILPLFDLYGNDIQKILSAKTRDVEIRQELKDFMQEFYMKMVEMHAQGKFIVKSNARAYLFTIANNSWLLYLSAIQRQKNAIACYLKLMEITSISALEDAGLSRWIDFLYKEINAIRENRRRKILELWVQNLSYKGIAETLNISVDVVRRQLQLSKDRIRENWKKTYKNENQ